MTTATDRPSGPAVAVVVVQDGRLPAGTGEAVAEAGGLAILVGAGASSAAAAVPAATKLWTLELDLGPGRLSDRLAPMLDGVPLVLLPASPDGRDLAPRLAASMERPLLAEAVQVDVEVGIEVEVGVGAGAARPAQPGKAEPVGDGEGGAALSAGPARTAGCLIRAELLRVDGQVVVPVECRRPVVATLALGGRAAPVDIYEPVIIPLVGPNDLPSPAEQTRSGFPSATPGGPDPEVLAMIEPDPATMDLADARRVIAGGAGLVPRNASDPQAQALFQLLAAVAATLGASMGATRVATDAGWTGPERQIGTTGVAIDPDVYVAFGVSGAAQHTGGLGAPSHVVSVNTDPACPMTAMANLGLVADAPDLLLELAEHLGVDVPPGLEDLVPSPSPAERHA
jgi:electron transfer flavoprotein alpha subunit